MAVQEDILKTTFQILGAAELLAAFSMLAKGAEILAAAEEAATAAGVSLAAVLAPMLILAIALTASFAEFAGSIALVKEGLKAFSEESNKLFQTGVILKNIGSSLTLPQVQQMADQTSRTTGISRPEIEGTAGLLARTGVGGEQIKSMLTTIGDSARGVGKSFTEVGEAVEKGILGHMRGLAQFGITLQDTGSKAANLALIQQQLNLRFEGAAAAFRETLPGAIYAFQSSLQVFLSTLGEKFAPVAIRVFNAIASVLDFLTDHIQELADAIANMLGGPLGVIALHIAQAADAGKNPMAQVGHGGDPASEKTLAELLDATKMMADAVESQVLGGGGEIVRQSFGYLHARIAMNI